MIITKNGVELRNLEEQVQENSRLIAEHYNRDRVLADFGIRIVGTIPTETYLPDPNTFTGEYGDAYFVGAAEPYSVWVWTRPDINSGHPNDYWLNIGPIAIEGPVGPQGPQGERGPVGQSTKWRAGSDIPHIISTDKPNDLYFRTDGSIYQCIGLPTSGALAWNYLTNIKGPVGPQGPRGFQGEIGPQGPQGLKGNTGDVGGLVNVRGVLPNIDQLPTPSSLNNLSVAYLVGSAEPYDLYIQVGQTPALAQWTNTGAFNAATLVMVNGVGQNVWDADTKVDKTEGANKIYATNPNGNQMLLSYATMANGGTVPIRGGNGDLNVETPATGSTKRAVNIEYLNSNAFLAGDIPAGSLPIKNYAGNKNYLRFSANADNGTLVYRDSNTGLFKLDDAPLFGSSGYLASYPVNMGIMSKYAPIITRAIQGNPTGHGIIYTLPTYPTVMTINATDYINIGAGSLSGDGPFDGQGLITIISIGNYSYVFKGEEKTTINHQGTLKIKKSSLASPDYLPYIYGTLQTFGDGSGTTP